MHRVSTTQRRASDIIVPQRTNLGVSIPPLSRDTMITICLILHIILVSANDQNAVEMIGHYYVGSKSQIHIRASSRSSQPFSGDDFSYGGWVHYVLLDFSEPRFSVLSANGNEIGTVPSVIPIGMPRRGGSVHALVSVRHKEESKLTDALWKRLLSNVQTLAQDTHCQGLANRFKVCKDSIMASAT